jgi:hypothetical protein
MAAALLGAGYVLAVVLQLNPALPLDPVRLTPIALTVVLFYAAHLTTFFYACLVLRSLLAREPFSPAWISVSALSRLAAASAAAGALLTWLNLRTFELVLPSATVDVMFTGMLMDAASALLFVVIMALRAQFGTRLRRVWALLLAIVAAGSVAAPIAIRGRGVPAAPETRPVDAVKDVADVTAERSSGVTILAIDAASLELITNATADGRLPNFGRLLDAGAVMHLATLHPTSAEAVWAAAATGKLPQKNGVRSLGTYRLARASTVLGRPRTADARGGETVQLMPEYCYANALMRFGLEHSERAEYPGRGRRMAADAAGTGRPWVCGERRIPAPRGNVCRDRGFIVRVSSGRARGTRRRDPRPAGGRLRSGPGGPRRRQRDARSHRSPGRPDCSDTRTHETHTGHGGPLSEPRCDRPLLPPICDAIGLWRRHRRRAPSSWSRARSALRAD